MISYLGEHIMIYMTGIVLGYFLGKKWQHKAYRLQKRIAQNTFLKNYHIHHTFIGLFVFLFGLLLKPLWVEIVICGIGSGLFVHGSLNNGLFFITKIKQ